MLQIDLLSPRSDKIISCRVGYFPEVPFWMILLVSNGHNFLSSIEFNLFYKMQPLLSMSTVTSIGAERCHFEKDIEVD
jgi:hypothetical protein